MDLRRIMVIRDTIHSEGGLAALRPVTRVAACAVIGNPLADRGLDDLSELVPLGEQLGALLVREALAGLRASAGRLWEGGDRRPGRRSRTWRGHHPSAHGPANTRGDRRRLCDYSVERQGGGARDRQLTFRSPTATTPGCSTISTR